MEERSKLQKAVLISMAAMVVLFGVLMVAARFFKRAWSSRADCCAGRKRKSL